MNTKFVTPTNLWKFGASTMQMQIRQPVTDNNDRVGLTPGPSESNRHKVFASDMFCYDNPSINSFDPFAVQLSDTLLHQGKCDDTQSMAEKRLGKVRKYGVSG
jgi:hypothetical protein